MNVITMTIMVINTVQISLKALNVFLKLELNVLDQNHKILLVLLKLCVRLKLALLPP